MPNFPHARPNKSCCSKFHRGCYWTRFQNGYICVSALRRYDTLLVSGYGGGVFRGSHVRTLVLRHRGLLYPLFQDLWPTFPGRWCFATVGLCCFSTATPRGPFEVPTPYPAKWCLYPTPRTTLRAPTVSSTVPLRARATHKTRYLLRTNFRSVMLVVALAAPTLTEIPWCPGFCVDHHVHISQIQQYVSTGRMVLHCQNMRTAQR